VIQVLAPEEWSRVDNSKENEYNGTNKQCLRSQYQQQQSQTKKRHADTLEHIKREQDSPLLWRCLLQHLCQRKEWNVEGVSDDNKEQHTPGATEESGCQEEEILPATLGRDREGKTCTEKESRTCDPMCKLVQHEEGRALRVCGQQSAQHMSFEHQEDDESAIEIEKPITLRPNPPVYARQGGSRTAV
jgi:hypothetical protein